MKTSSTFFRNVLNQLLCFDYDEIILGGDFNLVLDVQKTKKVEDW